MKVIQQSVFKFFLCTCFALLSAGLAYGGVGISGTGRSSFGSITAFGSIFVNGIEYSTSTANIIINGVSNRPESELKLGMAVRVEGSINPDGLTGTATIVEYIGDIEGSIDAAPVITGTRGTFRIYGLVVNTDSKTTYDNVASLAALAGGDVVEVSGFINANDSSFTATRIEKKPVFRKVELRGYVSNVTATTFVLGPSLVVNYSAAQLKDIPPGGLVNGLYVEVKATAQPTNNVLPATRVSVEGSALASTNIAYGLLQGVAAKVTLNSFEMGNQLIVTNSQTVFKAGTANAPNGLAKALPVGLVSGVKAFASGPVVNGVMTAEVITVAGAVTVPVVVSDFSGDAKSDLVFRNSATGQISAWLMNGVASTSTGGLVAPGNWNVSHTADFNGDGKADILYRNDDGSVTLWIMNGLTLAGSAGLLGPNPDWRVSHVGDFNGDGKADILWRNTNGAVTLWLMDGTTIASSIGLLGADPGWSVSHVADFNGDGKADLLWRNTNGAVTMWLMNGTAIASTAGLLGADPNWRVSHVADFDGDGKADLLWRNTNGAVTAWLMNGSTIASTAGLLGPDANWSVSHTGDFNADGKADLLWRNSNGAVTQWLMNGTSILSSAGLLGADPSWRVTHLGDYNGDGKADLIWRNTGNGAITMWLMNGAATLSAAGILGATTWGVVPTIQ
jgi:FG-GAP-like repeat/Domain of unknown function (DUF5666)/FG-GAP repeat